MESASISGRGYSDDVTRELPNDKVVREIDVCLSSGALGNDTKVGNCCR